MSRKIISSIIFIICMTSCQYYRDLWIPPEKIDLRDRKMYKSKPCSPIHYYDIRYPLCPNQKCRDQLNNYLKYYGEDYGGKHWDFYLKECRKLKE